MCDPVSASIAVATAVTANEQRRSREAASKASSEQARIMQEAEAARQAQAQAEAERIRQAELSRQQNITTGASEISSLFGQFDDNFYNNRSQSYIDYAMPQLQQQYEDQQRELMAQLARSGNTQSSVRGDLMGKLQEQFDRQRLAIADRARSYANEARSNVNSAKSRLMESNANLADPGTIRTMAQAEAGGLLNNPQYASLGQLITDLTSGVTGSAAKAAPGQGVELYGAGLDGSGRVVS